MHRGNQKCFVTIIMADTLHWRIQRAPPAHAPLPTKGLDSFILTYKFSKRSHLRSWHPPHYEVSAPPPPPTGNPGSGTALLSCIILFGQSFLIIKGLINYIYEIRSKNNLLTKYHKKNTEYSNGTCAYTFVDFHKEYARWRHHTVIFDYY